MRLLARLLSLLILIAIVGGAGYYLGYRSATGRRLLLPSAEIGTTGSKVAAQARQEGTTIGRTLSAAGNEAEAFLSDAALTTKIKSKMGLDDYVDARSIHVSTRAGVVTLSGTVRSAEERRRAVAFARETKGVKSVVDRLEEKSER